MSTAEDKPKCVQVEAGKTYAWCSCALSQDQPFCDGSHKGTEHRPVVFKPDASGDAWLCMCKKTKNAPYCDGSHNS